MATDYDPTTCITAAEMRASGWRVPDDVPDVAWVPRASLRFDKFTPSRADGGVMHGTVSVTMTAPFRWVETTVSLAAPNGTERHDPTNL